MNDFDLVDDLWGKTEVKKRETEFVPLPKGAYHATVTGASLDETTSTVKFEYTITDLDYAKRKVWQSLPLKHEWAVSTVKENLLNLNLTPPASIGQLALTLEMALDLNVEIFVTQKEYNGKTYNNAYLNGVLDVPAVPKDSDVPF